MTMAELVDAEGRYINKAVMYGLTDKNGGKLNDKHTITLNLWPNYPRPLEKVWRSWKKWTTTILHPKTQQLKYQLH
jgi:hypothetical protein